MNTPYLPKSFTFVLSLIDLEGEGSFEVIPGHRLEKASPEQREIIKSVIVRFQPYGIVRYPYEYNVREDQREPGLVHFHHDALPEEEWRYWVITFNGINSELHSLESALSLLRNEIELGMTILGDTPGLSKDTSGYSGYLWHAERMSSYFNDDAFGSRAVAEITGADLQQVGIYYGLIKNTPSEHDHIRRSLRILRDLKSLPRKSELVIIGLFSILESIITHSPKLTESADSITHQIRTKIPLLKKRFDRQLNYSDYFRSVSEDKLWTKLYEYRSRIVHGEDTSITDQLSVLMSKEAVREFMHEIVKLLLIVALREPDLVTDLKRC